MSRFYQKFEELKKECTEYITKSLEANNNKIVFATEEEQEKDDFFDDTWEYPQATYVGKYDHTYYYAILSVSLEDGKVFFKGIDVGENRDEYIFGLGEVDLPCLVDTAALMESKLNEQK